MKKIKIKPKDLSRSFCRYNRRKNELLINKKFFSLLEMDDIKYIYNAELDKLNSKGDYEDEFIFILQTLAYNRDKSKYSDEIATYVFDKIFELISNDTNFVNKY